MSENPEVREAGASVAAKMFSVLRREILDGKFKPFKRFPSEQQLMRRFSVARTTVRLALDRLKQDGILETRNGSGTYLSEFANRATGRLGLIVPCVANGELALPICSAISQAAANAGYTLLFGDASAGDVEDRKQRAITLTNDYVAQGVAGVFLSPIEFAHDAAAINRGIVQTLTESHVPVVLLDRDIVPPPARSAYDLVSVDNVKIGYQLALHLMERGARRICFVARENSAPTVDIRFQGVREAILDCGQKWERWQRCRLRDEGCDEIKSLFQRKLPPDALICANDITAFAVLNVLRTMQIRVPEEVMVCGVDDVRLASMSQPPLTSMHQPCREIGKMAVAAMLQRLRDPTLAPRQILLDAQLFVRESTGGKS